MCGIAGTVFGDVSQLNIEKALGELQNRGPDGHGVLHEKNLIFVHTRLSIIDLSEHASQPMVSSCGRYVIVFNGEIYNYRELRLSLEGDYTFHSQSDTEVILALFSKLGAGMLSHLRGMFALAIWDRQSEELFVARDRLGVKPLYFASAGERFAFASRPRVLCKLMPDVNRAIDKQALRYFLEAGYIPAPFSIFEGIRKLEPGNFLTVTIRGVVQQRYWTIDQIETDQSLAAVAEEDLLDELDALIEESVRMRLVSDVPVGAFLSGGIDSSLVTAYMMKHVPSPVKTFTVGFEEKAFDESGHAAAVAASLGTVHTREMLAVDDLMALMPTFVKQYDEPFFDYSAFPVMAVSRLARQSVTVSLSGDGGDEAFGGYHYYQIMRGLEKARHIPFALRRVMGAAMQKLPVQRLRWLGEILAMKTPTSAYAFMRGVIKDAGRIMKPALVTGTQSLGDLFAARAASLPKNLSYAELAMRLDLAYTLPDDYLQKVDVGSMAFSLEARDPLLDHAIIEWAARLPLTWKIRNGTNKYLLRKLAYRHIPREILDRKKMGFSVPMAHWLRTGLRGWGEALLADDEAFEALELNAHEVRSLWVAHQSNKVQAHTALWSVLVLLQFYRSQLEW